MTADVYKLFVAMVPTSWGVFRLAASAGGIVAVGLPAASDNAFFGYLKKKYAGFLFLEGDDDALRQGRREIEEYLAAERRDFDVPFHIRVTPFQFRVLEAISTVPYGETVSYGELARRLGAPNAARAVGAACAANPIPIIIPCHRVVASLGLGGFGGGSALKRRLLALEAGRPSIVNA